KASGASSRTRSMRRPRSSGMSRQLSCATFPIALQNAQLLLVRSRELLAEQAPERVVPILRHFLVALRVTFPIRRLAAAEESSALALSLECLLQLRRVEAIHQVVEARAHPGEHRKLVIADIVQSVGEGFLGTEVRGVAAAEQIAERILRIR